MSLMPEPSRIAVTGASGGLGGALALEYAAPGRTIFLAGRSRERLNTVARECLAKGAVVDTASFDVRDRDAVGCWVRRCMDDAPLDLAIACAGVSASVRRHGGGTTPETLADVLRVLEVNATATAGFVSLVSERMISAGRGQIALVSSLAAYHGLPSSPAYSAAKAAVRIYGLALRPVLLPLGVHISVISPGYVDTSMSRRLRGFKPFCWPSSKAAARIVRALRRDPAEFAFPWPLVLGLRALGMVPGPLARFLLSGFDFEVEPDEESPLCCRER